jgi:hypothetical protein
MENFDGATVEGRLRLRAPKEPRQKRKGSNEEPEKKELFEEESSG